MRDLMLTQHFVENWQNRVGPNVPTAGQVIDILRRSIKIQRGGIYKTLNGQPFTTLSIYWDPDLRVIIKIDNHFWRAVSVIAPGAEY